MEKKNYRLAALDMDGTLLGSDHQISAYSREVLAHADKAGKTITLATGRCLSELRGIIDDIPAIRYAICENGAAVYDLHAQKCIHRVTIPQEDVEFAISDLEKRTVIAQMYILDQSYLRTAKETDLNLYRLEYFRSVWEAGSVFKPDLFEYWRTEHPPVDKMDLYFTSEADRDEFRSLISQRNLEIAGSIGLGIEVSSKHANKASGLKALCSILSIPLEETLAIGDSDNDRGILQTAGFSVAMGNALPEIRAIASAVTDDCDNDGAAKALEKYLMIEVDA